MTAVLLVGGDIPDRRLLDGVDQADVVVAVDGGIRIARSHGFGVQVLIGDLDSCSPDDRAWALDHAATVIEHPVDKDATDLELALDYLATMGADTIVALGVDGGRLDHELGNWSVLCRPSKARVEIRTPTGTAYALHGDGANSVTMTASVGDTVSILPVAGQREA